MNELKVNGSQNFMGIEIPVVEGGFGDGKKVILARTIAEIHGVELRVINQIVSRNEDEFEFGVDIIDLKQITNCDVFSELGFTKAQWGNAKNIYLLSEQGYMLLVGFMKTDKAKEIRKQLRREYFAMRELINTDEQLKAQLLLKLYNGGADAVVASKQLHELEMKIYKPMLDIADTLTNKDHSYDIGLFSKVLNIPKMGRNNLFKYFRENKLLRVNNEPYQNYINHFEIKFVTKGDIVNHKTLITDKGVKLVFNKLVEDGYIITKTLQQITDELKQSV